MDNSLTSPPDPHSQLVWPENGRSPVLKFGCTALGHQAPEKIAYCNGSEASIFLLCSMEAGAGKVWGDLVRYCTPHHDIDESGEVLDGSFPDARGCLKGDPEVFGSEARGPRGRAPPELLGSFLNFELGEGELSNVCVWYVHWDFAFWMLLLHDLEVGCCWGGHASGC